MNKNRPALILLYSANSISGFAQGISMLSIPWYFVRNQHASGFNLFYGVFTFAALFWGLYAGTLIDKYNRKRVFISINIVCGFIVTGIGVFGWFNSFLPLELAATVFAVTMLNYNIHYPALYAFGQEITVPENYGKLNSQIEIVGQSTSFFAGLAGAQLIDGVNTTFHVNLLFFAKSFSIYIPRWQIWEIFLLDGITYFIATALIFFIRYKPSVIRYYETGGMLRRIITGFSFLKENKPVFLFGLMSYAIFATVLVEFHAVLPMYISNHLHSGGYVFALSEGTFSLGALLAGVFIRRVFQKHSIINSIIFLMLITGGIYLVTAFTCQVSIVYMYSAILGFANAGTRVLRMTYLFKHVSNNLIGRVNSVFNMLNVITRTGFILLFGLSFFAQGSNITHAFTFLAGFLLISTIPLFYINRISG